QGVACAARPLDGRGVPRVADPAQRPRRGASNGGLRIRERRAGGLARLRGGGGRGPGADEAERDARAPSRAAAGTGPGTGATRSWSAAHRRNHGDCGSAAIFASSTIACLSRSRAETTARALDLLFAWVAHAK